MLATTLARVVVVVNAVTVLSLRIAGPAEAAISVTPDAGTSAGAASRALPALSIMEIGNVSETANDNAQSPRRGQLRTAKARSPANAAPPMRIAINVP